VAMQPHIGDREQDKFVETADGETAVRVKFSPEDITDDDGDSLTINSDDELQTIDVDVGQTLMGILTELRIMNVHLQAITNQKILKEDVCQQF